MQLPLDLSKISARYSEIIADIKVIRIGTAQKIRIMLRDASYLDFWFSETGRYSYHWERRHVDGKIFRFDNAPHHVNISTFPHHFHNGSENSIVESSLSRMPEEAISQVLDFVQEFLKQ